MGQLEEGFVFAVLALLLWGIGGFFPKIATVYLDPRSNLIYQTVGCVVIARLVVASMRFQPAVRVREMTVAVLAGLTRSLGVLCCTYALTRGESSVSVTMTALCPLITTLPSIVLLKEALTPR